MLFNMKLHQNVHQNTTGWVSMATVHQNVLLVVIKLQLDVKVPYQAYSHLGHKPPQLIKYLIISNWA